MLDHIGLRVADVAASRDFYDKALAPLGIAVVFSVSAEETGGQAYVGYGRRAGPTSGSARASGRRAACTSPSRRIVARRWTPSTRPASSARPARYPASRAGRGARAPPRPGGCRRASAPGTGSQGRHPDSHRSQVGDPPQVRYLPGEDPAAPDRSVVPVPDPVDRDAGAGPRGRGRDVGPVVLHRHQFKAMFRSDLAGKPGGEELRVEVVGDDIEPCAEDPLEVPHGLLQVFERCGIPDIAHVRGSDGKPVPVDRGVCVQLGPTPRMQRFPRSMAVRFGAIPRERRMMYPSRTTESSQRLAIVRSWVRK